MNLPKRKFGLHDKVRLASGETENTGYVVDWRWSPANWQYHVDFKYSGAWFWEGELRFFNILDALIDEVEQEEKTEDADA